MNLEALREILADNRTHIAIAEIVKVSLNADRTLVRVQVKVWPEMNEVVAIMSWDFVGDDAGDYTMPLPKELVLVAFADGSPDTSFVLRRLTSKEEKMPIQVQGGHTIKKARGGKKLYLASDTKVCLSKGGESDPTEPFVLGTVFKQWAASVLDLVMSHTHPYVDTPVGAAITSPSAELATGIPLLKASPIEDGAILSDTIFGEK